MKGCGDKDSFDSNAKWGGAYTDRHDACTEAREELCHSKNTR